MSTIDQKQKISPFPSLMTSGAPPSSSTSSQKKPAVDHEYLPPMPGGPSGLGALFAPKPTPLTGPSP